MPDVDFSCSFPTERRDYKPAWAVRSCRNFVGGKKMPLELCGWRPAWCEMAWLHSIQTGAFSFREVVPPGRYSHPQDLHQHLWDSWEGLDDVDCCERLSPANGLYARAKSQGSPSEATAHNVGETFASPLAGLANWIMHGDGAVTALFYFDELSWC